MTPFTSSGSSAWSNASETALRISLARSGLMSPLDDNERANPSTRTAACCGVVGAGPVVTSDGGGAEDAGGVEVAVDACGDRDPRVPAAGSPPPRANAIPAISAITIAAATTGQTHPRLRSSDAALLTR